MPSRVIAEACSIVSPPPGQAVLLKSVELT
jgi:hypothetical protein